MLLLHNRFFLSVLNIIRGADLILQCIPVLTIYFLKPNISQLGSMTIHQISSSYSDQ